MNDPRFCIHCKKDILVEDEIGGEVVCPNCGHVIIDKVLDRGPEWRVYGSVDDSRERVGAPLTYLIHDMGLSTIVSEEKDEVNSISKILKKNIFQSGDRILIKTLSMIHNLSSKTGLPDNVEENAALIVRRAWRRGMNFGRRYKAVAAASLYASCKMFSIPRTMEDFANIYGVSRRALWNAYRSLNEIVKLKKEVSEIDTVISKIVNRLRLRGDVERLAVEIIKTVREFRLVDGRKPESLAAASVYIAARRLGFRLSQRRLADIASITEGTLRNRYKELLKVLDGKI
ncbi:MAG: TFIIB-type zinc ribbon-containing protein [Candidatus Caldarchaeales archaeon]